VGRLGRGTRSGRADFDALLGGEQEIAVRAKELGELLRETTFETYRFYRDIAPDGRELTADERAAALERLELGAICSRTVDRDRDIVEHVAEGFDLRPTLAALRSLQHSLVLALSEDAALRSRAMTVDELQARLRPVYEFWLDVLGGE